MKKNLLRVIAIFLTTFQLMDPRPALALSTENLHVPVLSQQSLLSTQALMNRALWLRQPEAKNERVQTTHVLRNLGWIAGSAATAVGGFAEFWHLAQQTVATSVAFVAKPFVEITFHIPQTVIVRSGDTLSRLFGVHEFQSVAQMNHIANPNLIHVNQVLKTGHDIAQTVQLPAMTTPDVISSLPVYAHPILHEMAQQALAALHHVAGLVATPSMETAWAAAMGAAIVGTIFLGRKIFRGDIPVPGFSTFGLHITRKTFPALLALFSILAPAQERVSSFAAMSAVGNSRSAISDSAPASASAAFMAKDSDLIPATKQELLLTHKKEDAAKKAKSRVQGFAPRVKFGGFVQGEVGSLADSGRLVSFGPYVDVILHWGNSPIDRAAARTESRTAKTDQVSRSKDDQAQLLSLLDVLIRHDQLHRSSVELTRVLLPLAEQISADAEKAGNSFQAGPTNVGDLKGYVARNISILDEEKKKSETQAYNYAKLPVEASPTAISDDEISPEVLSKLIQENQVGTEGAAFDPSVEKSVLDTVTVLENSQDTAELQLRGIRRFLPSDITLHGGPNFRHPTEMATPFFWLAMIEPTWLRAKQADWKAETDKLKTAQQALLDDRLVTLTRIDRLLLVLRSTYQTRLNAVNTRNFALEGAKDKDRAPISRDQFLRSAVKAQLSITDAAQQEMVTRVILLGLGFTADELDTVMADTTPGSDRRLAQLAVDRTKDLTQTALQKYFDDSAKHLSDFMEKKSKNVSPKATKQREGYRAQITALRHAVDEHPISVADVVMPAAPSDITTGDSDPTFATDAPATSAAADALSTKAVVFQRPDPFGAWMKGRHGDAPLASTPDSNAISQGWTETVPLNVTLTFNAKKAKDVQKFYTDAVAQAQKTTDLEKTNVSSWKTAQATLDLHFVDSKLTTRRAVLAAVQKTKTDPLREAALHTEISQLETDRLHLKEQGAQDNLALTPDGLPVGFVPEALPQHDVMQGILARTIATASGQTLKQLPVALGVQNSKNAIFTYIEPDISSLILMPVLHSLVNQFSGKSKKPVQDLVHLAAKLQTQKHILDARNALEPVIELQRSAVGEVTLLQTNLEQAHHVVAEEDRSYGDQAIVDDYENQARGQLEDALLKEAKVDVLLSIVKARYQTYKDIFETDPTDSKFDLVVKATFGKTGPAERSELLNFRNDYKETWETTEPSTSIQQQADDLKIKLAGQLPGTATSFLSGFNAGPFAADTFTPPTAPSPAPMLLTYGGRAGGTLNIGKRVKNSGQLAEAAKRAELEAAKNEAAASAARQAPLIASLDLISKSLREMRSTIGSVFAQSPKTSATDHSTGEVILASITAASEDYASRALSGNAALGNPPADSALLQLDAPLHVLRVADPESFATRLSQPFTAAAANGDPKTFQVNVGAFAQRTPTGLWSAGGSFTTGAVGDPRRPKLAKQADAANTEYLRRQAELAAREAHRQNLMLARDINHSIDLYRASLRRVAQARANLMAILKGIRSGLFDQSSLSVSEMELRAAYIESSTLKGHLVSLNVTVLQQAANLGLKPGETPDAQQSDLSLVAETINPVPLPAPQFALTPEQDLQIRKTRTSTEVIFGSTANAQTRSEFEKFVTDNHLENISPEAFRRLNESVSFYKEPNKTLEQQRRNFFNNIELANSIAMVLNQKSIRTDSTLSVTEAYVWAAKHPNVIRSSMKKIEPVLALGRATIGENWQESGVELGWVDVLLHRGRKLSDTIAAAQSLNDPGSIREIKNLMALSPIIPSNTLELILSNRAATLRSRPKTAIPSSARLKIAVSLLRVAQLVPDQTVPPAEWIAGVLRLATVHIPTLYTTFAYRKRLGAYSPSESEIADALETVVSTLAKDDLKPRVGTRPITYKEAVSIVASRAFVLFEAKATTTPASTDPSRIKAATLRIFIPFVLLAGFLTGGSERSWSQTTSAKAQVTAQKSSAKQKKSVRTPDLPSDFEQPARILGKNTPKYTSKDVKIMDPTGEDSNTSRQERDAQSRYNMLNSESYLRVQLDMELANLHITDLFHKNSPNTEIAISQHQMQERVVVEVIYRLIRFYPGERDIILNMPEVTKAMYIHYLEYVAEQEALRLWRLKEYPNETPTFFDEAPRPLDPLPSRPVVTPMPPLETPIPSVVKPASPSGATLEKPIQLMNPESLGAGIMAFIFGLFPTRRNRSTYRSFLSAA